ncbi:thymidylate kinase, putative [Babesia bigemina]|uniref:dTMP kinase n=1 Tax=Babesia bigemina TaxID=5866 RepID=A0A061D8M0_BABBI|nr:thymidylate kinase, putative [Babesia bigemina]CDR96868.1 thymidylate kinase, putative [Babesia bigemina]|eukprot:XP_012769054.1 thymidylate kinase, putative [Babesia bigemina]
MSDSARANIRLPGKLFVFEGIDRSGKTTQLKLLSQKLTSEGISHRLLKFPCVDTKCGKVLVEHLASRDAVRSRRAIHLLFSANRWEMMKEVVSTLESGTHILMDRYAFSGVAYSVGAENLSYEWCIWPDDGLVSPDLVIYLDNPATVSASRSNFGKAPTQPSAHAAQGEERYEEVCKLEAVRRVYDQFRVLPFWQCFDATQSKEDLSNEIYEAIAPVLRSEPRRLSDTDLHLPRDVTLTSNGSVHLLPPFV